MSARDEQQDPRIGVGGVIAGLMGLGVLAVGGILLWDGLASGRNEEAQDQRSIIESLMKEVGDGQAELMRAKAAFEAEYEFKVGTAIAEVERLNRGCERLYDAASSILQQAAQLEAQVAQLKARQLGQTNGFRNFVTGLGDTGCIVGTWGNNPDLKELCSVSRSTRNQMMDEYDRYAGNGSYSIIDSWSQSLRGCSDQYSDEYARLRAEYDGRRDELE